MISISTQPVSGSLQAAYLPVPYSVRQTGVSTALPPALGVVPINGEEEQPSFTAGIDTGGSSFRYRLDLSGVAAGLFDTTEGVPSTSAPTLRVLPGSVVKLSARFVEYAAGQSGLIAATGNTKTSNACFVLNAYRRADDADPTLSVYGNFYRPAFLTRRPRATALGINDRDTISVFNAQAGGNAAPTASATLTAQFQFFAADGTLLRTKNLDLPGSAGSMVQMPFAPGDIGPLGLGVLTGVAYYSVTAGREGTTPEVGTPQLDARGDTITVYIERGASDALAVYFYNSFGAWERILFSEPTVQQYALSGSQYSRLGRTYAEERQSRWTVQVTSSTNTADEADALLDLANASLIYAAPAGRLVPVTLSASALPIAFGPGSNGRQPFQFTLRASAETRSQRAQ